MSGLGLRYLRGGTGKPIVVLHHSTGNPGWAPFHAALAAHAAVIAPDLPGYGQSARPDWAREPRDLAILMLQALERRGAEDVALVGLGFGGFVAAEMLTMNRSRISHAVLVGAPGHQPDDGEILDQMMVDYHEYVAAGFSSKEKYLATFGDERGTAFRELWDFSREMTARLTWKPYMFNRRLAPLLREVETPVLLVWGSADAVVPPVVGRQYLAALPNARLEVLPGAGHFVEYEEPDRLARLITSFVLGS